MSNKQKKENFTSWVDRSSEIRIKTDFTEKEKTEEGEVLWKGFVHIYSGTEANGETFISQDRNIRVKREQESHSHSWKVKSSKAISKDRKSRNHH